MAEALFLGIDVGSQGVRLVAAGEGGAAVSRASAPLASLPTVPGTHEQDPAAWWPAVCRASRALLDDLKGKGYAPEALAAVAVDGTSGTLAALDTAGRAVRPALMYNDGRSGAQAAAINALPEAAALCGKLGYRFASSFALAKIVWLLEREPGSFERTVRLAHQADVIAGQLIGDFAATDYSNALKTGYDLVEECWPAWFARWPGVLERLPRVAAPGMVIGQVTREAAAETGLPAGLPVAAGASDGTAGFLASGAGKPGDYNTTLGTTLVFKGVSAGLCGHPDGLIYCHKLPGGLWLPGAASNTGGEWIARDFAGENLAALDAASAELLPSPVLSYPNLREGERFPFLSAEARGFSLPEPANRIECFAAGLQGTALVERLGYQVLDGIAGTSGGEVYSTGGGSRSDAWCQLRADVTGRTLHRPACPESAFGSAVLAAVAHFGGVPQAIAEMVRIQASFAPDAVKTARYDEIYGRFCEELRNRGYLKSPERA
jgi:xylulokinase